ncbi:MAG: oxidoreductase [Gemmatales bacterium]|nr:MAG: oxidoreductase [Gemmatales bacterium]
MPAGKLRWGILGVAKINERLIPRFSRTKNAELLAIASRSLDRAKAAAQASGIARAYGSYEALLDDPDIDAVYNPLPNTLHAEWTKKAADKGKHILCEKPLAPSAAEAQHVVDYCRSKKVCLMDGFMWPHHPRTAKLRDILDSGTLGDIRRVSGSFTFRMPKLDPSNIRLRPELAGGSLLDVGCYPVFGIRWALRTEPIEAFARAEFTNGVDVAMTGMLRFPHDRFASFDCGFTVPTRQHLEITGTNGVLSIDDMWIPPDPAEFHIFRDDDSVERFTVEGEDQIVHMIENFGRSVLEGVPLPVDPQEAVKTLCVLDALAESARKGSPIAIKHHEAC